MANNDAYELELVTSVNNIICRNVFHFILKVPGMNSEYVAQQFMSNFVPSHKAVFSAYAQYIQVRCWLLKDPVVDSYSFFYEGEGGSHPAVPIDPRIALYASLRGTPNRGNHSNGGIFFSGVPQDWAQFAPKVDPDVAHAYQQVLDAWVAFFGADIGISPIRWVIVSRKLFNDPLLSISDWAFPVREARVRPYFASLRTRRPKHIF